MARGNRSYKYGYQGMSLRYYCKIKGLNYYTIHQRIRNFGWTIEEAITGIKNPNFEILPGEEWREIKGYEGFYDVSNYGRVRTYWKITNTTREVWEHPRLLNPRKKKQTTTYACVTLFHTHKRKRHFKVCRLVAQAFLGLDYNNKYILVCHKDDDGMNNHVDNLFLGTHKDNIQDSIKKGRCKLNNINKNI